MSTISHPSDGGEDQSRIGNRVRLNWWRLTDAMEHQLIFRSFPIEIPLRASLALFRPGDAFPTLGKILVVLEHSYGPSTKRYDDYKQSFRFPCLLEVKILEESYHFLLSIMDWKGGLDFRFRRMKECERDLDRKPEVVSVDSGITDGDFEYVTGYLLGWIEGYVNVLCEYIKPPIPFFRSIQASLTVYGYDTERGYFEYHFRNHEEFDAVVAQLRMALPKEPILKAEVCLYETRRLIEQIKTAPPSK